MPKNIGGGKRYKKRKNKGPVEPGPIPYADGDQEYGIVTKRLGNGQIDLMISKNGSHPRPALGKIRGILRKRRVPFNVGSIVIVSTRECISSMVGKGDSRREKVDVLHCYWEDQANRLYRENKIPLSFRKYIDAGNIVNHSKNSNLQDMDQDDDGCGIIFDDTLSDVDDIDDL